MFHRDSGYDTAYIGSSNLSNAALIDGVEWNVRLSRIATPSLLDRFESTFSTYWNDDPAFEEYLPDVHRDRLDDALRASAAGGTTDRATLSLSNLDVRPYPYQQAMLEELWAERSVHHRTKNLIVAATGTGKTVLAALDYRHLAEGDDQPPRLLFVAHRKEILDQSLRTFREVLGDANFGESWVGGARPERWNQVFASVQSITSYGVDKIPSGHFDIVIIDEFHHAEAATYRKVLGHLQPRELIGLTATPERADGVDVRAFFDGRIATELRLWDALGAQILCPFHYFGIADGTDLSRVTWARGCYDAAQLEQLYMGDDSRVRMVLAAIADKIVSPSSMRALGFCVSVAHAEYMADRFTSAGIRAVAVHGHTNPADRATAIADLRTRNVNVIFSVDVFNEGLDIPDVDTILMLRPTESATIFLQQLGRGLRSRPDKPVLTVLDFVGVQRDEFRWDRRIRSMTGLPRGKIIDAARNRFPYLPSGCRIVLDEQTQASVISNLKNQLAMRWPDMVSELRNIGDVPLSEYLDDTGLTLVDVLKSGKHRGSWAKLRRDAGLINSTPSEIEAHTLKRIKAFAHVDDGLRAHTYRSLLTTSELSYDTLDDQTRLLARMMHFSVWPSGGGYATFDAGLQALRADVTIQRDILDVIDVAFGDARHEAHPLDGSLSHLPLRVHARYSREEALAGLDLASFDFKPSSFMEGVKYVEHLNADALFISLQKTEKSFSPSTMYRDYPISRTLIHWQSQNKTSLRSPTGQRYVNGTSTILVFIRHTTSNELGPNPYTFLGPASLVSHEGERPISITWKLHREMPAEFFNEAKVAAG
ncbi:helicase [Gordonia spumicola]|uniref:Helicase n=1 Tax=Gordonia spumicola TaxID=589161 RepID=A0A7I9V6F6_9ACTN|nr:helicase [Gordonia spumicola]